MNALDAWQPLDLTTEGAPPDAVLAAPVLRTLADAVEAEASRSGLSRGLALQLVVAAGIAAVRRLPSLSPSNTNAPTRDESARFRPRETGVVSHRRLEDHGPRGGGSFPSEGDKS